MKTCKCCGRPLEPGRSPNAEYRLDCTERIREERRKPKTGYMPGWKFFWIAVMNYNVGKHD